MSSSIPSNLNFGSFVPTTSVWEIQQIQSANIDANLKEILVRLYQNINNIAIVLNGKDSAMYNTNEFLTGQTFFPTLNQAQSNASTPQMRPVYRTVVNFGPLPNATTKTVPHNIPVNAGYTFTRIYGAASNATGQSNIPIPFSSSVLNENIKLEITNTNASITTGIDYSSYTNCYIITEYIKAN